MMVIIEDPYFIVRPFLERWTFSGGVNLSAKARNERARLAAWEQECSMVYLLKGGPSTNDRIICSPRVAQVIRQSTDYHTIIASWAK